MKQKPKSNICICRHKKSEHHKSSYKFAGTECHKCNCEKFNRSNLKPKSLTLSKSQQTKPEKTLPSRASLKIGTKTAGTNTQRVKSSSGYTPAGANTQSQQIFKGGSTLSAKGVSDADRKTISNSISLSDTPQANTQVKELTFGERCYEQGCLDERKKILGIIKRQSGKIPLCSNPLCECEYIFREIIEKQIAGDKLK
jgi:hypothetical protein